MNLSPNKSISFQLDSKYLFVLEEAIQSKWFCKLKNTENIHPHAIKKKIIVAHRQKKNKIWKELKDNANSANSVQQPSVNTLSVKAPNESTLFYLSRTSHKAQKQKLFLLGKMWHCGYAAPIDTLSIHLTY